MKRPKLKRYFTLSCSALAGLGLCLNQVAVSAIAAAAPQRLAQTSTAEPAEACVALQEVTTGQTEIRKRIENRLVLQGNWNTDFLVPNDQNFAYFVALITPENTGPYEFMANLVFPQGGTETALRRSGDIQAGMTYSIPFQSPTGRQPAIVNARVGGVNGNFYTIAIAACESSSEVDSSGLTGTTWELQQIQLNDGQVFTADPPQNYTLEFTPSGEVFVQADCNRSIGSYTLGRDNRMAITLGPTTLAACPPDSISNDYLRFIDAANSFFFQDGDLFIELKFDSGTMQFSPAS
ncbi:META domain-containing protein [Leptolyngbya iicbica]|uniref:META domain-containing protein n=2 Tax=Cyanophyceae TaxID=3028117 RepID=A0A4Q7E998_9CYAN|nr:META domain-containing protein [Leptolyngbya sp. LK]RZM79417.1 META domain-containing protein [Leptolyngbya sp. LK]